MKCWICHKEMENTIGGCYHCKDCGVGVNDLVFRLPIKNKKNTETAKKISELQDPKPTIINSSELGTLGAYFEADAAQKKVKELKQQLADKDKHIEFLCRKNAMLGKENRHLQTQFDMYRALTLQKDFEDPHIVKTIRHKVCEEIRKMLELHCEYIEAEHFVGWYLNESKIGVLIDQIEGENK